MALILLVPAPARKRGWLACLRRSRGDATGVPRRAREASAHGRRSAPLWRPRKHAETADPHPPCPRLRLRDGLECAGSPGRRRTSSSRCTPGRRMGRLKKPRQPGTVPTAVTLSGRQDRLKGRGTPSSVVGGYRKIAAIAGHRAILPDDRSDPSPKSQRLNWLVRLKAVWQKALHKRGQRGNWPRSVHRPPPSFVGAKDPIAKREGHCNKRRAGKREPRSQGPNELSRARQPQCRPESSLG